MTKIIRRKEAASRLGVTPQTIDKWARQGIIKKHSIKGRIRSIGFRESEIDRIAGD